MTRIAFRLLWFTGIVGLWLIPSVFAQTMLVRPDRAEGVYRVGETVRWMVEWPDEQRAAPAARYTVKRGGRTEIASGEITFVDRQALLEAKLDQPDTLLLEVSWRDGDKDETALAGAVCAPERIRPAAPAPDDFDAFWTAKLAELAAVPVNARVEPARSPAANVQRWKVTMDNIRGSRIHGQLARPAEIEHDLPALLIVQWAGVYGLQPEWVTDRAREGWLVLNILPHDLPIDETEDFYTAQRNGPLKDYWTIGNTDRDQSYFLRMYLSCYRAVEYLKSRPEWNGRTLVVMGTSQGGQQTLVTAGLHPDITAALPLVPSGCDTLAPAEGRAAAFPNWYDAPEEKAAAVRETSRYYDAAHFAARITCPVLIGVGLEDLVCPPGTVLAAANQLKGYRELIILADSGHQDVDGSQQPYFKRVYGGWLPALRAGLPPPVALTAEQDHRRLLRALGITALRPGADPRDPTSPHAANTDEARAQPYSKLPDSLVTDAGRPVTTPSDWWNVRRPEIVAHFEREVYGRVPAHVPGVTWEVRRTFTETKGGVPVVTKQLAGRVDNRAYPFVEVTIDLTLSVPAAAAGPVPVMLHFGWPASIRSLFPTPPGPTWEEQVLAQGWGVATYLPTSVQADHGAGLTQGIIGLTSRGQPRGPEEWGALRAWAWGASRALDYFATDPTVDAGRVGLEGLSRYGKAVLVAMAFDPRFAVALVSSSGAGGAKLHRRDFGERVENLASAAAYHWMAGNYLRYAGPLTPDDLPVDAHELIALCAPRPVFIGAGAGEVEGHWIDQRGMFLATVAAAPVYELLGQQGLGTAELPAVGEALVEGALGWRQHEGGHTTLPNWPTFLAWANRRLGAATEGRWLPTWVSAQQVTEPHNLPPPPGFAAATVRQNVMTSIGGERVRVRLSNVFGDAPLTIDSASLAISTGHDRIVPGTSQPVTFNGAPSVTIQPGVQWISDTIDLTLDPLTRLAVTVRTTSAPAAVTGHPGSRTTSYFVYGDVPADAPSFTDATPVEHWYFLSGIDVWTENREAAAIAILGDSITDGRGSTTDCNDRWPDELSRRLRQNPATAGLAVLNQGIGGNRVLRDGLGPSLLARLDRDVIAQPVVKWLIIFEGINDLGTAAGARAANQPAATAADIIAAFDQAITRARDHGIKVLGATITPYRGAFYHSEEGEADRQAINTWIRESGRFDAVLDFDAAVRDPQDPTRLAPAFDTGDHLHLSTVGLKHLADSIDLSIFGG